MVTRLVASLLVIGTLATLIIYSQIRPVPNKVSGYVEADEVRLGSRVGGRVVKVHVDEGQQIHAGQVLVELEPFDLLEREKQADRTLAAREAEYQRLLKGLRPEEVAQAKANRDQLKAKLDLLVAGPREQEIKAARARHEAAQAEFKLAEQLYERNSKLAQNDATTKEELDRTRQAFDSAIAMLTVRANELELLELGTREEEKRAGAAALEQAHQAWQMAANGFRAEDIAQAKATRDAAQATLDAIGRQKSELVITSPVDGIVESLDLQPGDMVGAGAPVMSIVEHSRLWVRAFVPQNRVALKLGQVLKVTVDSVQDRDFQGTVTYISQQGEFTPSNVQTPEEREKQVFRIKVQLSHNDLKQLPGRQQLRPGMSADVWLDPVDGHE